ncbi:hypothetical protein I3760_08G068300 [Carya illinoinensis]|uniref:Uncharacterized protein n=1 Tax=Carya illinoinensis TaxID=32201 RepID=A0A922JAY8_CARIL|nr:hypothetical protein I3760_08G068300 [Carya illinoinensis]KAG6699457.1 hypothetical protein I3842_08G067900 [Carya illinoinensis]
MMQREEAPLDQFTADEIEAADILLHLPQLFFESKSRLRFPSWGARRKRSLGLQIQSFLCFGLALSPESPPSEFRRETEIGAVVPKCQKKGQPAVKTEASSPVTPLAFMPSSESEEKPEQSLKRKLAPKRKREDWLEIIDELNRHRDSLNEEIEYLRLHCTQLRASNLEMKAKLSLEPFSKTVDSLGTENQDKDRTVRMHSTLSSSRELDLVNNNVDPSPPLPDLNLSAEDTFAIDSSGPFDLNPINGNFSFSRVVAAQARQRRMQIYRAKKLHCR